MNDSILAFDIGLTNAKVILWSAEGELLDRARVRYPTYHPQADWAEQRPEDWWKAILEGMWMLHERSAPALEKVVAISVTGHMHALVCLDEHGQALGPSFVLGDQRSIAESQCLAEEIGLQQVYRITGARSDASMPIAKIRWLNHHQPEICRQTSVFMACKDWIRHRLTGDVFTDPVDACATSLYDLQGRNWSPELTRWAGIQHPQLPTIVDSCHISGGLDREAARALGIKMGIPVVVGAGDDVEVLGNGLLEAGLSLEHLGTTGSILTVSDHLVYDPQMAVEIYPHTIPGLWVLGGSVTAAGSAMTWVEQVLDETNRKDSSVKTLLAPNLQSPLVFLPHLVGERCPEWDPYARGCWMGLSSMHRKQDLYRAVMEGITFSLKRVLDSIEGLVGIQKKVTVTGEVGSDWWLIIRANIYDRLLAVLKTDEPTALGAMILAAVGVGIYPDIPSATRYLAQMASHIQPDDLLAGDYAKLYRLYCTVEEATRAVMRQWQSENFPL